MTDFDCKRKQNQGTGWLGRRERSDKRRDLSARDSIHSTTFGSVCIANRLVRQEMSRTPSCVMQYFYLAGQFVQTSTVHAKPVRCLWPPIILAGSGNNLYENTRKPGRYRSTNDSVMKSERSSLVKGSDPPKCHKCSHSVICGVGRQGVW